MSKQQDSQGGSERADAASTADAAFAMDAPGRRGDAQPEVSEATHPTGTQEPPAGPAGADVDSAGSTDEAMPDAGTADEHGPSAEGDSTEAPPSAGGARSDVSGGKPRKPVVAKTRFSALWVGVTLGAVLLILLLVFIVQNNNPATIYFFGASGSLPLGVALTGAAIAGVLVVAIPGYGRILQLRKTIRRGGRGRTR
ncbi:MAG: LapA family protein [Sciscionella sp.]